MPFVLILPQVLHDQKLGHLRPHAGIAVQDALVLGQCVVRTAQGQKRPGRAGAGPGHPRVYRDRLTVGVQRSVRLIVVLIALAQEEINLRAAVHRGSTQGHHFLKKQGRFGPLPVAHQRPRVQFMEDRFRSVVFQKLFHDFVDLIASLFALLNQVERQAVA